MADHESSSDGEGIEDEILEALEEVDGEDDDDPVAPDVQSSLCTVAKCFDMIGEVCSWTRRGGC